MASSPCKVIGSRFLKISEHVNKTILDRLQSGVNYIVISLIKYLVRRLKWTVRRCCIDNRFRSVQDAEVVVLRLPFQVLSHRERGQQTK